MDTGHHNGRWGCLAFDDDGPHYFVRSDTAPRLLFGPIIVPLALRGWWLVRRGKAQRPGRALERAPTA